VTAREPHQLTLVALLASVSTLATQLRIARHRTRMTVAARDTTLSLRAHVSDRAREDVRRRFDALLGSASSSTMAPWPANADV
jgi:hypothetical protein